MKQLSSIFHISLNSNLKIPIDINRNKNDIQSFKIYNISKKSAGTGHMKPRLKRKFDEHAKKAQEGQKRAKEKADQQSGLSFAEKRQQQIDAVKAKQQEFFEKQKAEEGKKMGKKKKNK